MLNYITTCVYLPKLAPLKQQCRGVWGVWGIRVCWEVYGTIGPSLVSTHTYLCSLTFSLRPDEVASVWRQQKLVFENMIYCFVSATRRYYIMDTNNVSSLFSFKLYFETKLKKKNSPDPDGRATINIDLYRVLQMLGCWAIALPSTKQIVSQLSVWYWH